MDYVLKISKGFSALQTQIINPNNLSYQEELVGSGKLTFTVPILDENSGYINPFAKVELCEISDNADTTIWTGFIDKIYDNENQFTVECADEKTIMYRRVLENSRNYESIPKTLGYILNDVLTEYNTRAGFTEHTYETSITDTVAKSFEKGANYYAIFSEIATLLGAEWKVYKDKVIIQPTIGQDKTTGAQYTELLSDINNPDSSNINFSGTVDSAAIATAILGKAGNQYAFPYDSDAIFDFGRVESFESFDAGSVTDQTQSLLDTKKETTRDISVLFTDQIITLNSIVVGDRVKLRITRNNSVQNIDTDVKIISKNVVFVNKTPRVSFTVSKTTTVLPTPANKLKKIKDDVEKLKVKV
jgi:hypothetical protein